MLRELTRDGSGAGEDAYEHFLDIVAERQLRDWLASASGPVVDLTPHAPAAAYATAALPVIALRPDLVRSPDRAAGIRADDTALDCLQAGSVSAVVAEQGALAQCLLMEETLERVRRVLRPGGRLLLCVESVVHGMATLAAQQRWAELADAPRADVVLVGNPAEGLTRCFHPVELRSCATDAGLEVDWVRPRTVLAASTVQHLVQADPHALASLVNTELRLAAERDGEVTGRQLLLSARSPG